MTSTSDTERIERSIVINGSRQRVWRALTRAEEFGAWLGADLSGLQFTPGERTRGQMNDPGGRVHFFNALIERIEPQALMTFRWHPYSGDAVIEYENGEPTLVTLTLRTHRARAPCADRRRAGL